MLNPKLFVLLLQASLLLLNPQSVSSNKVSFKPNIVSLPKEREVRRFGGLIDSRLFPAVWTNKVKVDCPHPCECDRNGLVNCSRLELTSIPKLPIQSRIVDLSYNSLTSVPNDSFSGLKQLEQLMLAGNSIKGNFAEQTFKETTSLEMLDLTSNQFDEIPKMLPRFLIALYIIDNQLTKLDFGVQLLSNLTILSLEENQINNISKSFGSSAPNLTGLDISFNNISDSSLSTTTFQGLKKLTNLNLRFNFLTKPPEKIPHSVLYLDLVGNPVTILHKDAFVNMTQLVDLPIWQSSLTTIEDFAFRGLVNLTMLELMDCTVSSPLTNFTFYSLHSVTEIDLSLSKIPRVDVGAFRGMSKLKRYHMSSFRRICPFFSTYVNGLPRTLKNAQMSYFFALLTLWLNDNPLKTLAEGVFSTDVVPSISEIYLWGDQWTCDCNLKWLKIMQENSSVIQDEHLMKCKEPRKLAGKAWDEITSQQFVC